MLKTYIEPHTSSLTAQTGEEQQNERDEPRARDEDDNVGRRREGRGPGLRNWAENRKKIQGRNDFNAETPGFCASTRRAVTGLNQ